MTKELEALKTIKIKCHPNSNPSPLVDDALEVVEQALIKAEENEKENIKLKGQVKYLTEVATEFQKVLNVLVKKLVDIASFKAIVSVHPKKALEYYNQSMGFNTRRILKQEEFDLLKRYFYDSN